MSDEWLVRLRPDGEPPRPGCSAVTIAAATEALGPGPVAWAAQLAPGMTEEIIRQVPEHGGGPAPFDTLRRSVESSVLAALAGFRHGIPVASAVVPKEALEGGREFARRAIPLDRVLRGIRLGHAALHRALMEVIGDDPDEVRRVSELLFGYADVHASTLAEEYIAERDRWVGSTAAQRRRVVEDLLAGRPVEAEAASRVLGYDVRSPHTALILSAADARTAPQVLQRLAAELAGTSGSLAVPASESSLWLWVGGPLAEARAGGPPKVAVPPGVRVAAGPPAAGIEGFRRSHLGARAAESIGISRGAVWCDYADVRVVALCTADPEQATWFVRETLGPLAADDERVAELRQTLRAYLAAGRSLQAAATDLHVARNTVTYRVKRAEELLGHPVAEDRLEVQLALEIAHWLPPRRSPRRRSAPLEAMYVHTPD
ncbi:PucR family transcriptional regulator [Nonomuraea sp. MTCD27]|uniref:PucR family transcriptional regulator n=1 Tax=Nonomuraea sp. MTCD27 TaxID=1676747 RepID=UPI0035C103B7